MRPGTEVFEPGRARLLVTTGPLGRGLGADVESRCSGFQRRTPLHNHFRQLLSTMNRQSGILVIVHSVSPEKLIARHNQLLSFRSNGQPVETSHLAPEGRCSRAVPSFAVILNQAPHKNWLSS